MTLADFSTSEWIKPVQSLLELSLLDSHSRFFYGHLCISLLLVGIWSRFTLNRRGSTFSAYRLLSAKKYWFNNSTMDDYKWITANFFVKLALAGIFSLTGFKFAQKFQPYLIQNLNIFESLPVTTGYLAVFSFVMICVDDLLRFLQHFSFHKMNLLRRLHGVHHSAQILTPLTLLRIHPIESLASGIRNLLVSALTTSLFLTVFGRLPSIDFLGFVLILNALINAAGAPLRHSPFPISFGVLEYVFISPAMHQLHHENHSELSEKNFGVTFSIWDRLFGTFEPSKKHLTSLKDKYEALLISIQRNV